MKRIILSAFLVTILGTSYGQAKKPEVKPFTATFNETESNRIFFLLSQMKSIIPKSKVPFDEGTAIINNADTVLINIQQQYNAWIASQKKDTTGKK
jgi:hypothetical protein